MLQFSVQTRSQQVFLEVKRMPRAPRVFLGRAFYHVYGRIARGERILAEESETSRFVDVARDVKRRDGLTRLAW